MGKHGTVLQRETMKIEQGLEWIQMGWDGMDLNGARVGPNGSEWFP